MSFTRTFVYIFFMFNHFLKVVFFNLNSLTKNVLRDKIQLDMVTYPDFTKERGFFMKKIVSLMLIALIIAAALSGCTMQQSVKVAKDGKTTVSLLTAIPVDMMDTLMEDEEMGLTEEDLKELKNSKPKMVDGEKCYVEEEVNKFATTKKANNYMIKNYGEDASGFFKTFKVDTIEFNATLIDDMKSVSMVYGDQLKLKLNITLPYVVTKTNGTLSDNKKTVTFDLTKGGKLYAYTTKSKNTAKVYFKKDYLKTNTSAYISWNSVKGATKYQLQYKASGQENWKKVNTTKTEATVKNLKVGKKYTFKVTAITESKKYTSINTYITTLKKTQTSVKSKTNKSVTLKWNKNTNADGYIVYRRTSTTAKWKTVKTVTSPYTNTYTVTKLSAGKKYYFKVVSYSNENGKKVLSNGNSISTKTKSN